MRAGWIRLAVLATVFLVAGPGVQAQTAPQPGIPDLSGIWVGLGGLPQTADTAICSIAPLCGALTGNKIEPNPNTAEEPEMLLWAEQQYNAVREGVAPTANPPQQLNPSWSGCMPEGVTEVTRRRGFELRQFQDIVLVLYDQDHGVRRIYLDGRGHPSSLQPSWMGHSVGRYDGDTLVIDTVGVKSKVWLDNQGHPHTEALRVTERIRRVQPGRLEIELTIDDPQTYKKPWKMKLFKGLEEPGPRIWDEAECEEMLEMGTHYSAEAAQ